MNRSQLAAIYLRVNHERKAAGPLKIISCTEAGNLLNTNKEAVRKLVEAGSLKNYGNKCRYMVNEIEILKQKLNIDISLGKRA